MGCLFVCFPCSWIRHFSRVCCVFSVLSGTHWRRTSRPNTTSWHAKRGSCTPSFTPAGRPETTMWVWKLRDHVSHVRVSWRAHGSFPAGEEEEEEEGEDGDEARRWGNVCCFLCDDVENVTMMSLLCVCSSVAAAAPSDNFPPQLKRPRVSVGAEDPPPPPPHTQTAHARHHLTQPHTVSHLTHTHLSQASPASSLDSPATPTTSLASPAAPAPTHTEHTHSSSFSGHTSPYPEQLQPLSLTTKPQRPPLSLNRVTITTGPSTPSSNTASSPPQRPPPLRSQPFLAPPPTSSSSHGALTQQLRRTNQPWRTAWEKYKFWPRFYRHCFLCSFLSVSCLYENKRTCNWSIFDCTSDSKELFLHFFRK